ncbi:membrane-associated kinase regulator 1 [Hibiscus trionum]|uniref:Membrane-associated kinase regulator 1 n=1 Tax=Hibiscus trionum TaxID=183268 RepID=A0A9W7H6J3_HIBTR|nr:membrane-associated kinase regulator 1 [Hibiscus trionum]
MVMGKKREKLGARSQTLPSSPSHSFSSSSSSDFEFTISLSPRAATCPADDLFYKGQLLPLHLSPRLSMVRTLLLSSSSSSSTATASRDSTASSSNDSNSSFASDLLLLAADNCASSRPSSVSEDNGNQIYPAHHQPQPQQQQIKKNKYFSLSRFSSMFNNNKHEQPQVVNTAAAASSSVKKMSITAKRVISKYLKKVKPLYDKLSHKQAESFSALSPSTSVPASFSIKPMRSAKESNNGGFSHSFSGNLRYPRRRSCISSCPSSMRSSPSHSGVLSRNGFPMNKGRVGGGMQYPDQSSMEELQSAIQGAIAHCKNSLVQSKSTVISNEI